MKVKEAYFELDAIYNEIYDISVSALNFMCEWFSELPLSHAFIFYLLFIFVMSGSLFDCLKNLAIWMGDEELISKSRKE